MANMTQVIHMTKRYGNTLYSVNTFCPTDGAGTFEEKLLELIRNESDHRDSGQKNLNQNDGAADHPAA